MFTLALAHSWTPMPSCFHLPLKFLPASQCLQTALKKNFFFAGVYNHYLWEHWSDRSYSSITLSQKCFQVNLKILFGHVKNPREILFGLA